MATQAKTAQDLNGLIRLMMKAAMERMLDTEMDVHLGRRSPAADNQTPLAPAPSSPPASERKPNRRNGRSRKTVKGELGEVTLATPRIATVRSSRN